MTTTTAAGRPAIERSANPAWSGFVATMVSELKLLYREPQAAVFTLGQPFILLLILNAFNLHFTVNGQERPYLDRLLPGLIAFNGMTVGLNSTAFVMSRYKSRGVLRRVRATPIPTASYLAGFVVSRVVMGAGVTLVTYIAGVYVFGADIQGNVFALMALGIFGAAIFIAIGLLMVAVAKSEDDLPPLFILVLMPSMLFSGSFLDRSGLPDWLHWITNGLPLTFLANAVQELTLLGGGLSAISTDLLGLVIWGAAAAMLCAWKFRMA